MRSTFFYLGFLAGMLVMGSIMYFWTMPKNFEKRARNLNLYHYNSKTNEFILDDSVKLSKDDFYYLQHGNFKDEYINR